MAMNSNMAFFVAMAAAALVMNSAAAATTHQVGDGLGWTIPPGGAVAYTTWATNQTFAVSDTLVFTFSSGAHDVAKVTKSAFDSCSATNPISLETNSPATISLNSSGEHYFICTFGGHCTAGQKLAVNVTGASSPAPAPSTTTPPPSPSLSPPSAVPAPAPSTSTPPASPPATPPSGGATPPSGGATPPSGGATPPSGGATPPTGSASPPPSGTPTTPSSPPPEGSSTSPPPPPPNAATSLGVAGLSATLLSIALALLF